MVIRVGYYEWTKDNKLRVPVFKGIRDDKGPSVLHVVQYLS